jgi:hypothetical protein
MEAFAAGHIQPDTINVLQHEFWETHGAFLQHHLRQVNTHQHESGPAGD